jgi:hypothetical protein
MLFSTPVNRTDADYGPRPVTLTAMNSRLAHLTTALVVVAAAFMASSIAIAPTAQAAQQEFDEEVPPGNPVVGSDAPGDIEEDGANYGLLAIIAIGLIAGGLALVKLEAWERRRSSRRVGS